MRMRIALDGIWKATDDLGQQARARKPGYDTSRWREVPVPGHWQQVDGLAHHRGRLLYRHSFSWTDSLPAKGMARLQFDGVFAAAKVWLNGAFLGEQTGYFIPTHYDVTRHLRPGENVVMLEVDSLPDPDPLHRQHVTGLFGAWEGKPPNGDPGGIWREVWLEIHPGVVPERFHVRSLVDRLPAGPIAPDEVGRAEGPTVDGPVTATVSFDLEFMAAVEGRLAWQATLRPETFAGEPTTLEGSQPVRRGWNRLQSALSLVEPHLWWTWDHGQPDLYRLVLEFSQDGGPVQRLERLIGLRQVELRNWHLYLNGRRIFTRGTQCGPTDLYLGSVAADAIRRDMEMIQAAHINLVRLRAHVARPELYEAASRLGILLWQDLPLQGLYGRGVLAEARRQASAMVDLVGHWPAVGLWCAHGDPFRPLDSENASLLGRALAAVARFAGGFSQHTLAPAVRDMIRTADPTRPCLSAPSDWGGVENRLWLGWHAGRPDELDRILKLFPERARFVAEFGAQSFPVVEHSRRFVHGDWPNLNWSDLQERRMLQPRRLERHVPHTLARSFEGYVRATQEYQAELTRRFIERLRRVKYSPCGGIMSYLFADAAPGVTWSLVDYWRAPKAAYQALQAAFRPLLIMAELPRGGLAPGQPFSLPVWVVNDTAQNGAGNWSWRLEQGGRLIADGNHPIYVPPDRAIALPEPVAGTLPPEVLPGPLELCLSLRLDGREEIESKYRVEVVPGPQDASFPTADRRV